MILTAGMVSRVLRSLKASAALVAVDLLVAKLPGCRGWEEAAGRGRSAATGDCPRHHAAMSSTASWPRRHRLLITDSAPRRSHLQHGPVALLSPFSTAVPPRHSPLATTTASSSTALFKECMTDIVTCWLCGREGCSLSSRPARADWSVLAVGTIRILYAHLTPLTHDVNVGSKFLLIRR